MTADGRDVTPEITALLMKAMELSVAAGGYLTGDHALIARAVVDADGTFVLDWHRYGPGMPS